MTFSSKLSKPHMRTCSLRLQTRQTKLFYIQLHLLRYMATKIIKNPDINFYGNAIYSLLGDLESYRPLYLWAWFWQSPLWNTLQCTKILCHKTSLMRDWSKKSTCGMMKRRRIFARPKCVWYYITAHFIDVTYTCTTNILFALKPMFK